MEYDFYNRIMKYIYLDKTRKKDDIYCCTHPTSLAIDECLDMDLGDISNSESDLTMDILLLGSYTQFSCSVIKYKTHCGLK